MYVSSCRPSLILHLPDVSLLSSPINQVKTSTCHLLTHFLLAVWRESERWGGSGALESAPVQFWDYRIVSICISMYLHLYLCVCLFAFPFGVAAVKIHNTTLIRSNGMTLSATDWLIELSALHSQKSLKSQTPNPVPTWTPPHRTDHFNCSRVHFFWNSLTDC